MKAGPRVEIVIDELVLHGFPPSDRDAIGASLSRELGRLVEAGGAAALTGLGDAQSLRSADVTLRRGAHAEAVGVQVAKAVHSSLGRTGPAGER
jgi:hypothetical protein